jgi:hypothetical protein
MDAAFLISKERMAWPSNGNRISHPSSKMRKDSAAMEQEKLAQRADTDQRLSGDGAPSLSNAANVAGHKLVGPQEGFGPLWRKVYRVRLQGAAVALEQVIAEWKAHFNRFWPANAHVYTPLTGTQPGEVAFVDLQPGGAPLSTGMLVLDAAGAHVRGLAGFQRL